MSAGDLGGVAVGVVEVGVVAMGVVAGVEVGVVSESELASLLTSLTVRARFRLRGLKSSGTDPMTLFRRASLRISFFAVRENTSAEGRTSRRRVRLSETTSPVSGRSSSLCVTVVLKSIHTQGDDNPPAGMCTTFHVSLDVIVAQMPCSLVACRRADFTFVSPRLKSIYMACMRSQREAGGGREGGECGEEIANRRSRRAETKRSETKTKQRTCSMSMLIGVTPSRRGITQM